MVQARKLLTVEHCIRSNNINSPRSLFWNGCLQLSAASYTHKHVYDTFCYGKQSSECNIYFIKARWVLFVQQTSHQQQEKTTTIRNKVELNIELLIHISNLPRFLDFLHWTGHVPNNWQSVLLVSHCAFILLFFFLSVFFNCNKNHDKILHLKYRI